jgi:hypothetical protein
MYYPRIFLEGVKESAKAHIQDSQSLGRELNRGPPEYEAEMKHIDGGDW